MMTISRTVAALAVLLTLIGLVTPTQAVAQPLFIDDPLTAGVTQVRAIHITQLRTRIDALRSLAGLAPFAWTDPVITPGITPVRAIHVQELRTALASAAGALGHPAPSWAEAIAVGNTIKAAHLAELRTIVKSWEGYSTTGGGSGGGQGGGVTGSITPVPTLTAGLKTPDGTGQIFGTSSQSSSTAVPTGTLVNTLRPSPALLPVAADTTGRVTCAGHVNALYGAPVYIYLMLTDPFDNWVASDQRDAYNVEDLSLEIEGQPTFTGTYKCYMYSEKSTEVSTQTSEGTAYVEYRFWLLDVTINTFIPENNFIDPVHLGTDGEILFVGGGDFHGFGQRFGTTRSYQRLTVWDPASGAQLIPAGVNQDVGFSDVYAFPNALGPDNLLTDEAKNQPAPGSLHVDHVKGVANDMYCATTRYNSIHVQMQCHGNPYTATIPYAPGITYHFFLDLWTRNGYVEFLLQGSHDCFPNYEVFLGDTTIYPYNHGIAPVECLASLITLGVGFFVPGSVR